MKPDVIPVATETLDELLSRCKTPEDFHALTKTLFKQVAERALQAEMAHHLGYDKHQVILAVFEPRFVGKHQRRVSSVTDAIIRLYAYGMSQRDIQETICKNNTATPCHRRSSVMSPSR